MTTPVVVFDDHRCLLGEGPIWHDGALIWVDIPAGEVHRRRLAGGRETVSLGQSVSCVVIETDGRLVAGLRDGIARFSFENGIEQWLDRSIASEPDRRCNDGTVDLRGRLWVGTMLDDLRSGTGRLHLLRSGIGLETVRKGLTVPNGLAWSADERVMYHIDSPRRVIEAIEFEASSGELGEIIRTIQTPDAMGYPDGMTIDADGMLWVAHWGGSCISRWDPERGEMIGRIEIPAANVTSCCFGGDDGSDLYITSASDGRDAGGEVFVCRPGVRGARSYRLQRSDPKPGSSRGA